MTATALKSVESANSNHKKLTAGDKAAAKENAPKISRVMPWTDLEANPDLQKEPRKDTTIQCALDILRERKSEGATLEEIQKSFARIGMEHHDPKALLRWMSDKRGFGFHMKKDGRVVLRLKND